MSNKKYKLLRVGKKTLHRTRLPFKEFRFYQLKALRDIPEHGVKEGDLGGYVTHRNTLSHEGSCWIGEEAQVYGRVTVTGNVYIGGTAVVGKYWNPLTDTWNPGLFFIDRNAKITGEALVESHRFDASVSGYNKIIDGNAQIFGNACLQNVHRVTGEAQVYGAAYLNATLLVSDASEIFGSAIIGANCKITGSSKILDQAKLEKDSEVVNSLIAGSTQLFQHQRVANGKINEIAIGSTVEELEALEPLDSKKTERPETAVVSFNSASNLTLHLFEEIQENFSSYETDIVKLIKYPAMADKSIPETLALTTAMTKAKRLSLNPDSDEFKDAVETLEEKFFIAESNALKMTSTILSDEDKKKTDKARDLLAIASDEASSENEKKQSFKQAFKQLEGVIAVPEVAVDTFRVKIGLQEIEA